MSDATPPSRGTAPARQKPQQTPGLPSSQGEGVWKTFETLARSKVKGAREMLLVGLEQPDAAIQLAATRAILRHARRDGVPHLIGVYHRLAPEVCEELIRNLDDFIFPLREALTGGVPQTRSNVVAIIRRAGRVKLAYLLAQALSDGEPAIRTGALEGLRKLAENHHREVELARSGDIDLSRSELEARKFALLDPIMALLGNLSRPQPDELLHLAMGLDPRTNELLFVILNSRQDPRSEKLLHFMWNAASAQVISFLLDCLRDRRVSNAAVTVIHQRRDLPFVKALLSSPRFFADYRVRDRVRQIEGLEMLKSKGGPDEPAGGPRRDVFSNALLALRAIHFLVLSGAPEDEKKTVLAGVHAATLPIFVTGVAETVLRSLSQGRQADEISLALIYLEKAMGTKAAAAVERRGQALEVPELELPWAQPGAESLPSDAFTQFFNTYDTLDEATKMLAVETLKRLDPAHLEHIRGELSSLEPEHRLRAVKMVVMFHREQDVESTLLEMARDRDRRVRATVVKTLGILEDEPAIRTLLEAVTDVDRRVVANSVEAIETVRRDELLNLVRIFVGHPNNRIRANAVKALWTMGDPDADRQLNGMLASPDEMMRLSATWLLGEIDHTDRIAVLSGVAKEDPSERVRAKALSILGT